jgi:uncharacterized protein with PhoU and TrkA domain
MGVHRNGTFIFNPKQDVVLQEGDVILVIGRRISIDYFKETYKGMC